MICYTLILLFCTFLMVTMAIPTPKVDADQKFSGDYEIHSLLGTFAKRDLEVGQEIERVRPNLKKRLGLGAIGGGGGGTGSKGKKGRRKGGKKGGGGGGALGGLGGLAGGGGGGGALGGLGGLTSVLGSLGMLEGLVAEESKPKNDASKLDKPSGGLKNDAPKFDSPTRGPGGL